MPIFDQDLNCPSLQGMGVDELYFKAWAELNIDIQTAAGVTVIVSASRVIIMNFLLTALGYPW